MRLQTRPPLLTYSLDRLGCLVALLKPVPSPYNHDIWRMRLPNWLMLPILLRVPPAADVQVFRGPIPIEGGR